MANALPWSVRGIDPDIREQAVEAAHRSGMSVGQWLNQVLAGNLDDEDDDDGYTPRQKSGGRRAGRRVDAIEDRLERLAYRQRQTAVNRGMDPMPDNSRILDLIENAAQAIERLEQRQAKQDLARQDTAPSAPVPSAKDLAETLRAFERKLDQLAAAGQAPAASLPELMPSMPPRMAATADSDPAFNRALAEIEARRRSLDGDVQPALRASGASAPAPAALSHPAIDTMGEQLATLVARIDEMRADKPVESHGLQSRLDDLASRIAEWRESSVPTVSAMRSELAALSGAVAELHPSRLLANLEDAMARTTERAIRLQQGDGERVLESIGRLNEDVRAVLRDLNDNRTTERLGLELGNLSKRVDLVANAVGGARFDEVARDVQALRSAVDQAQRNNPAEQLTRRLDDIARKIDQQDDRGVLSAIQSLNEQVKGLAGNGIKGLEAKLAEMTKEMKKLASDKQPLPQMSAIAERLERIDRLLDHRPDSTLGGLDTIAQKLDTISGQLDRDGGGKDDDITHLLSDLSQRIERMHAQPQDPRGLERLQDEIGRMFQKLEQMGAAPSGLQGLERNVADLFAHLDQTRRDMRDLAEKAANQAAEQAIRNAPRDDASDTLAAEGLLLIKRDLSEFKTAQSEAERRTRATLEALHGTLEGIVSKLGELETRKADVRPSAPLRPEVTVPPPVPAMPQTAPAPRREPPAPAAEPTPVADPPRLERDTAARADLDADLPLEPGMQPGATPAAGSSNDLRSQYLAAARRAAQAAAESSQAVLADAPKAGKDTKVRALAAGGTSLISRARKPILLGLAALIFSLGALKVLTGRMNHGDDAVAPPMPTKPAVITPAKPAAEPQQEGRDSKADPQTTGSVTRQSPVETQQSIPTIQPSGMMTLPGGKRGQKLSDSSAVTQSDPATTGSVAGEGGKPIETGRAVIAELVGQSALKGQDKLRDSAIQGNVSAWFEIGVRYADGKGMPRDGKLAARWFEQAAMAGHGPSQYRLGSLYREGKILSKEPALAFQWFDRAAAQGHVLAMHNAAVLLAEGVHGAPDYAGAALWFKRAAEHGVKDSQFNVAILFARGLGVNQDLQESYRWFSLAALQGDQDAAKKRDDIAARLTKEQIAKENERVKAFRPMPANPAANDPGNWEKSPQQRT